MTNAFDSKEKVSIIIPVYNEEAAIVKVVNSINDAFLNQCEYEIIIVDDASTDNTVALVEKMPNVSIIRNKINQGSGACRKQAILAARYNTIAMLDGDASYDATDLLHLIQELKSFDMVSGVRNKEFGNLKIFRIAVKHIIRKIAELLTLTRIGDLNTGIKVLRKEKLLPNIDLLPQGFSCVTTMTLIFILTKARVGYFPVQYNQRLGQSKFHPLFDTWRYFCTVFRVVWLLKPLNIFSFIFLFMLVCALFLLV